MNEVIPKYEYLVQTWGGFYNEQYKNIHKHEAGYYWFDTEQERTDYINQLRSIEEALNARHLMTSCAEGCHTRIETVCHRVVKFKDTGNQVYSTYNLGYAFPYDTAMYIMEWKWTPGENDYAAISSEEDLDKIETVCEWVTGAFQDE